jgi:hypothetical protein
LDVFNVHNISFSNPSDQISYTIAAHTLQAGVTYSGYLSFDTIVDFQPNAALPNSTNVAYYDLTTSFVISTVPVPSAIWLFGTGVIGFLGLKRRKQ